MTDGPLHRGRWKLTLEYDGTPFAGWQRQDNVLSVQEALEKGIFGFCGEGVTVHVAGRTDAGVHAMGQVAHMDIEKESDPRTVRDAINFHMRPLPVAVVKAEPVTQDFHARFGAQKRVYCYKLLMSRRAPAVLMENRVWHVGRELDLDAMRAGAAHLLGEHDFTTFRASECQAKSPVRTMERLDIVETAATNGLGRHIEIWAEAKSFLHHQIRNITGTLKLVGEGKWQPEDVKKALEARDRTQGGPTAPPEGLYFMRVDYDDSTLLHRVASLA